MRHRRETKSKRFNGYKQRMATASCSPIAARATAAPGTRKDKLELVVLRGKNLIELVPRPTRS
jgi:hypothetical protein